MGMVLSHVFNAVTQQALPLVLICTPIHYTLVYLAQPHLAHYVVCALTALLGVSSFLSAKEKDVTMFKLTSAPATLLGVSIICYHLNLISERFFVYLLGFFGILLSVFGGLFSNYVGKARYHLLSYLLTFVSLLAPPVVGIFTMFFRESHHLYRIGIMASILASGINIFCNKAQSSFAMPAVRRKAQQTSAFSKSTGSLNTSGKREDPRWYEVMPSK